MLILINGSLNTGKSTVSKLLAQSLPRPAILEVDSLRAMISQVPIDEAVPINLENMVLLAKNFLRNNFTVIIPYPLSEKNFHYVTAAMGREPMEYSGEIYTFTLAPPMEVALSNRGSREVDDYEKERIRLHYEKRNLHRPSFGITIDNQFQKPDETTAIILKHIQQLN